MGLDGLGWSVMVWDGQDGWDGWEKNGVLMSALCGG